MLALLAETSVFVHLDPRGQTVRVPPWFKNQPQLVLQIGLNMPVKIPDLDVGDTGISCTLSFSRRPFFCSIPWSAVFGLVGDNGPGLVWPDDVPSEIAAQVQAQTDKGQAKKPTPKEAPRGRLRAVGSSEPPPGPTPLPLAARAEATVASETPKPEPQPLTALRAVRDSPDENAASDQKPEKADQETDQHAPEPNKAQPSRSPGSNKPGSKRELPPYLRIVK